MQNCPTSNSRLARALNNFQNNFWIISRRKPIIKETDMNKTLTIINIILDIIILVMCVVGTVVGYKVSAWVLGMFVFIALMNNVEKLSKL